MRVFIKVLLGILVALAIYGGFHFAEHLATQELTRISHPTTQETVCLMWRPRFYRGGGVSYLNLLDVQQQVTDTAELGTLNAAFEALQQFGQMAFEEQVLTVTNGQSGEVRRFVVRDGRLTPQN